MRNSNSIDNLLKVEEIVNIYDSELNTNPDILDEYSFEFDLIEYENKLKSQAPEKSIDRIRDKTAKLVTESSLHVDVSEILTQLANSDLASLTLNNSIIDKIPLEVGSSSGNKHLDDNDYSNSPLDSQTNGDFFIDPNSDNLNNTNGNYDNNNSDDNQFVSYELVIDNNGQVRQCGATTPEGEFIKKYKKRAEQSLFVFLRGILGRYFLTKHFHRDVCRFLQKCPPARKLVLMPREHGKTCIVSGGLPAHILLQSAESNIYFKGLEGSECRILLAGETESMAKKNLRVIKAIFEENKLFRAFWPQRCWERIGRNVREWSTEAIIIPRKSEWPDPTVRAVGVGGAITGARPNVMIKDDLISFKASNSPIVMEEAIEWHKTSRALLDKYEVESGLESLEYIVGTRWAVYDLYSEIIDNDSSVEVIADNYHRIIRDGNILWPEKYSQEDIERLRMEHGSMFFLLYLNSAADPNLTDFNLELLRNFTLIDNKIIFDGDARDDFLIKRANGLSGIDKPHAPIIRKNEPINLRRISEALRMGIGVRLRS